MKAGAKNLSTLAQKHTRVLVRSPLIAGYVTIQGENDPAPDQGIKASRHQGSFVMPWSCWPILATPSCSPDKCQRNSDHQGLVTVFLAKSVSTHCILPVLLVVSVESSRWGILSPLRAVQSLPLQWSCPETQTSTVRVCVLRSFRLVQ